MNKKNRPRQAIMLSAFFTVICALNYMRLSGTENIRPIHLLSLLVCGMGIGVLVTNIFILIRSKNPE